MIEVFKTDVQEAGDAEMLIRKIRECFPESKTNFDLSDCDKILRVEGNEIVPQKIIELLRSGNYHCSILE